MTKGLWTVCYCCSDWIWFSTKWFVCCGLWTLWSHIVKYKLMRRHCGLLKHMYVISYFVRCCPVWSTSVMNIKQLLTSSYKGILQICDHHLHKTSANIHPVCMIHNWPYYNEAILQMVSSEGREPVSSVICCATCYLPVWWSAGNI